MATNKRFILRDSVSGLRIGPRFPGKWLAIQAARRRSYKLDNGIAVWWTDDTGDPKVQVAYLWNGVLKNTEEEEAIDKVQDTLSNER